MNTNARTLFLLVPALSVVACGGQGDPPGVVPNLEDPIFTYDGEEFPTSDTVIAAYTPDGTAHFFMRYTDVPDVGATGTISREHADHYYTSDDGSTWHREHVYSKAILAAQGERPLGTEAQFFALGDTLWAISAGSAYVRGVDGWQAAPSGPTGAFLAADVDARGGTPAAGCWRGDSGVASL